MHSTNSINARENLGWTGIVIDLYLTFLPSLPAHVIGYAAYSVSNFLEATSLIPSVSLFYKPYSGDIKISDGDSFGSAIESHADPDNMIKESFVLDIFNDNYVSKTGLAPNLWDWMLPPLEVTHGR